MFFGVFLIFFFFSSRRRHTRSLCDWSSDVCSSDLLAGAEVVYVKEWGATGCYGDTEADARLRSTLTGWCVRNDWFSITARECRVMHCLPVRRNTAIADEVLDSARSVVQREAYNRLPVQMAVLHRMLKP